LTTLNNSHKVYSHLKHHISFEQEEVWIICLNSNKKPVQIKRLFIGTVDSCLWHPRDILKAVFVSSCSSFIICHSHPGGDPHPSNEDIRTTKHLLEISKLVRVPMDDHVILCENSYYSFVDSKKLKALKLGLRC